MSIKLHMAVQTVAAGTRAAFYGLALIWLLLFLVPIITVAGKLSHPELPAKTWQGESRTAGGSVSGASYRGLLWFIWGSSEISYHFKIENDPTVYHGVANIPFTYFSSGELTVVYNPADPSQNFLKIFP
jgi:hypothetical protein